MDTKTQYSKGTSATSDGPPALIDPLRLELIRAGVALISHSQLKALNVACH